MENKNNKTKKKKKKHIYSNSKKEGLVFKVNRENIDTHNNMRKLQSFYNIPNSPWIDYISDIVYDKCNVNRKDLWNDFSYISNEIPENHAIIYIMNVLKEEEYFDPFYDEIPLYLFNQSMKGMIKKKQEFIKKYVNYKNAFEYKGFNVLVCYNNQRVNLQVLHCCFDIIILFNSYTATISISNIIKDCIDLKSFYKEIKEIEPNIWTINNSKTLLASSKNKKTKMNFYSNEENLNNMLNKIIQKEIIQNDYVDIKRQKINELIEKYNVDLSIFE